MWCPDPPSDAELADYYATAYVPARMGPVAKDQWPIWDTRPASSIVLGRLFLDFEPGSLFVDVGPGNGASLSLAPLLLPGPALGCVEFNRRSIDFFERHVDGLRVASSMDEFGPGSASIVYSAHSLEHFRPGDVLAAARSIRRALRSGGVLTLEVPFASSVRTIAARRHTPHLLFFSMNGLESLLTRAGFEVKLISHILGRPGNVEVAERMAPPDDITAQFSTRLATLNAGDLWGVEVVDGKVPRGGIKCVAVNRG